MKELLLAIILTYFITSVFAQHQLQGKNTVKGTVTFRNLPVTNATVLLQVSKDSSLIKGTITDSTGNFIFDNIDATAYFIMVQSMGSEDFRTPVFAANNVPKEIIIPPISLVPMLKSMKEVTVSGKKLLIEKKTGQIVFNIENSILSIGNSAWDIVNKAPEVKTDEQGNIRLRGNRSAAIMINNKLVNVAGEDLVILLRSISSENISKIEIISNPSARYDAEGTGGIINIVMKKNKEDGFNGVVATGYEQSTYAKYTAGLMLNFKQKNLTVAGNYGHKYGDYLTIDYLDQLFAKPGQTTIYNETLNQQGSQQSNNYKIDIGMRWIKKAVLEY